MSWTAETNIKGPAGPAGGISEAPTDGQTYGRKNAGWNAVVSGGGSAASVTVTPAGNIASSNVQAALQELDTEKVAKAGDTMTGNLLINKSNPSLVLQKLAAGQANQLAGYNAANARWSLALGDSSAESGGNAGSNFALYRYSDAGALLDIPLTINRVDGGVTLTGALLLAADPAVALGAATKQYVDNNIRAPATVAPLIDGTAAVGVATKYAREDHVHPSDVNARAVRFDAAQTLTPAQKTQARVNIAAPLRGWIAGLMLSTAGASASFGVAAGEAADSTTSDLLQLASAYTKTTAAWAVGSGTGALDTGAIAAAAWYHVYLIKRPDTGVVDVLVSLSATAPTLPVNYTLFRRIGSMLTAASQWRKFVQGGDTFSWDVVTPVDVNALNPGTAAVTRTLSTPLGVRVEAITWVAFAANVVGDNPGAILLSDLAVADQAPTVNLGSFMCYSSTVVIGNTGGLVRVFTNTSSQIRSRLQISGTNTTLIITTFGWVDRRGKDA
jgi:hypothetical protein